jgi:DNA modification methylase
MPLFQKSNKPKKYNKNTLKHEAIFLENLTLCLSQEFHPNKKKLKIQNLTNNHKYSSKIRDCLVEKAITNSSKGGDIIADFFGGSGSTLIACEKLNRSARVMELDPKYCDVIVQRWEEFTGKKAELINDI